MSNTELGEDISYCTGYLKLPSALFGSIDRLTGVVLGRGLD